MTRQLKPILKVLAKLSLLFILLLSVSCKPRMKLDMQTPVMDRNLPDETSVKVRITELEGDKVDYILEADRIERFYDRKILNGWKVSIKAYDIAGNIRTSITADTTIVDDARNLIFASGNVVLNSNNGSILTRRIIWDRNVDEITAPDRVVLNRNGSVLKGTNLRTNATISFAELSSVEAEGLFQDEEVFDW